VAAVPVDSARLIARYTVERATPNSSASSALMCLPRAASSSWEMEKKA